MKRHASRLPRCLAIPGGYLLLGMIGCWLVPLLAHANGADQAVVADYVLEQGTLVDGTGRAGLPGRLAIRGDRIVAVGDFRVRGTPRVIPCPHLIIAPGWIDLHNHSDEALTKDATRDARNYLAQGCTTLVTGNCGAGRFPLAPYLATLEAQGCGPNVAHLVPHGALREYVLGNYRVDPNLEQLKAMENLLHQEMQQGAWGLSTGLVYVPGTYAQTEELIALARVVGRHGGIYASHIRDEEADLLSAVDEALRIGAEAQVPAHVSHLKVVGRPYWGNVRLAVQRIAAARAAGQRVTADQYPYTATGTALSAMLLPDWAREGGVAATSDRIRRGDRAPEILEAVRQALQIRDHIRIARCAAHPEYAGQRLDALAQQQAQDIARVALQIIVDGDATAINFAIGEDDVQFVMKQPWVATASDGSAQAIEGEMTHPRSFGTFPRKVGHYVREQPTVSLEQAVRSCSGLPADILQLTDRGYLKTNFLADVVVFDPKTYADTATYDMPQVYPTGVQYLFVNGTLVIDNGQYQAVRAGRVLRKGR